MGQVDLVLTGLGVLLLVMGGMTAFDPAIFTRLYGVGLSTMEAKGAIGAIIGGSEIGIGAILVLRRKIGLNARTLLYVGGAVFTGILVVRFINIFQFNERPSGLEALAELSIAFLLLYLARKLPA